MGGLCSICAEANPNFQVSGISQEENSEKSMAYAENKCPISKKSPANIRAVLTSDANKGKLTSTQLKRVSGKLGLDKIELQNPDSSTFIFLNSLGEDGDTDEMQMLVIGILLSSSSPKEKAIAVFETHADESTNLLTVDGIKMFLSRAFDASIKYLPHLAIGNSKLQAQAIGGYLERLTPYKEVFINNNLKNIMKSQPEIGKTAFLDVCSKQLSGLLTASGIRSEVYKKYANKTT